MTDPGSADDRLLAFGKWIVRERELRGLEPDEVARATRLTRSLVDALESGEEARMPPRAYVVGYLRAYAAAVGLDADEVVLRYEEAAGAAPAGRRAGARRAPPRGAFALLAALAAAAAAAVWAMLR
jgi:cytoskeletal protein RodZ